MPVVLEKQETSCPQVEEFMIMYSRTRTSKGDGQIFYWMVGSKKPTGDIQGRGQGTGDVGSENFPAIMSILDY